MVEIKRKQIRFSEAKLEKYGTDSAYEAAKQAMPYIDHYIPRGDTDTTYNMTRPKITPKGAVINTINYMTRSAEYGFRPYEKGRYFYKDSQVKRNANKYEWLQRGFTDAEESFTPKPANIIEGGGV